MKIPSQSRSLSPPVLINIINDLCHGNSLCILEHEAPGKWEMLQTLLLVLFLKDLTTLMPKIVLYRFYYFTKAILIQQIVSC